MTIAIRLILAIVIGCAAWAASAALPQVPPIALFIIAAVAAAVLPAGGAAAASSARDADSGGSSRSNRAVQKDTPEQLDGPREEGAVKWFNVSKGFGFITKDNGDELFVHFRSIRGEGRRALRDGQRVSFVEAQTDKGPQAEDVEPL